MDAKEKLEGSLLLVRFTVSAWSAKVKDKDLQRENEERKEAGKDTIRVWRHLCMPEIKPIHSLRDAIRNHIYFHSDTLGVLAGMDGEVWRVMPSLTFDNHKQTIIKMIREWQTMVGDLCTEDAWNTAIERDMKRQGQAANRKNYPTLDDLKSKFAIDFLSREFAVSQTIFADIFDESEKTMKEKADERAEEIVENLMKSNIDRIRKPLDQLIKGMENHGKDGSYFKDVTINQIAEMVDAMKGFNITNNKEINEVLKDIKLGLFGLDAKVLRESKQDRTTVAGTAKDIVKKMETYF